MPAEAAFWDSFDPDYFFALADRLSQVGTYELGFRPSGSRAGHRAGDLILKEMCSLGLKDVRKEPFPVYAWDFAGASVGLDGWAPVPASSFPPTPGTSPEGLYACMVDAGHGTAADYVGLDVQNRIAFVRFDTERMPWMDSLAYEAELRGARALVFYYVNGYAQHESGRALNTHDGTARTTIPILQVSKQDGLRMAERMACREPVQAVLHSQVTADPAGTGYNVVGTIPGCPDGPYLIVGAHYDAWFRGYWDNAVGVAGMLAIASTAAKLLEAGHRPRHTLLFVATDAEEFGAPDTHFDWLIGCYHMLQDHPEWQGRVSAALNIDTLAFLGQEELGFISPPELLPFLRETVGRCEPQTFPKPTVRIKEQVTAWTETLTYSRFGIPTIQPRFALKEAKERIYHTQFDDRDVVHRARAVETLQVCGVLLLRLDHQPSLPYSFGERVDSLRRTLTDGQGGADAVQGTDRERANLVRALDRLEERADRLPFVADDEDRAQRKAMNDALREAAGHLIDQTTYLNASSPDDGLPLHVFYERDWRALDAAVTRLVAGDARAAIGALADGDTGVHGAWCALDMSYPVYHRNTLGARNPARGDLYWGRDRTAMLTDVWQELHSLDDKVARGVTDFGAEIFTLRRKKRAVAEAYREALSELADVIEAVTVRLSDGLGSVPGAGLNHARSES
jgi:Iap family predicted aminopeptidase